MRLVGHYLPPLDLATVATHSHRHAEWHFMLSGSCRFEIGESEVGAASGDMVCIPEQTAHRLRIDKHSPGVVQMILYSERDDPRDDELMRSLLKRSSGTGVIRAGGDRHAVIQRLILDANSGDPVRRYGADMGFTRMVYELASDLPPSSHPGVARALSLMRARLSGSLRLAELVAESGCCRSLFLRLFHAEIGQSPLAYFQAMRLDRVAGLLREQDRPISAIAREAGFDDPYHFSRCFHRRFGLPPSQWREQRSDGNQ